jgi:hypothetical protein
MVNGGAQARHQVWATLVHQDVRSQASRPPHLPRVIATPRGHLRFRGVQPAWTVSGEALFPGYLPQRQMTFPGAGIRAELRVSFLPLTGSEIPGGSRARAA